MVEGNPSPERGYTSLHGLSINNKGLEHFLGLISCLKRRNELALQGRWLFSGSAASKAVEELPDDHRKPRGKG